ncbi:hypothetical protein ACFQH9_14335, partial [Pseudonocardia lutea]
MTPDGDGTPAGRRPLDEEPAAGGCCPRAPDPVDLCAILSDDALLDALGRYALSDDRIRECYGSDPVVDLLLGWRGGDDDQDTGPPSAEEEQPVAEAAEASEAVPAAPAPRRADESRRARRLPMAAAAALVVGCLLGAGLGEGPGTLAVGSADAARVVDARLDRAAA